MYSPYPVQIGPLKTPMLVFGQSLNANERLRLIVNISAAHILTVL